jgi:pyruvate/2-oxoglutarate dehydrogenase complex dihydrolipoamide acyltransferase (E2) component
MREVTQADLDCIQTQLGRTPRDVHAIAYRCPCGKPAVVETPEGDVIAVRHKMFLSHSYDHRVVDGASGAAFLQTFKTYMEQPAAMLL